MAMAVWCCACSNTPVRIDSRALAGQMNPAADRLIIAAVDSGSPSFMAHAGSTPRGYDSVANYGPTAHALTVMRSVESDYGLHEVSAWPIEPLRMHCAVLEAPAGANRATLLATLSRDERVKLAQPLQSFTTRTESYNDPYVGLQRGFQQMNVAGAHPWSQGEGVRVALIDTGADVRHKDLKGNIAAAVNFVDSDSQQFVRDRHGTEMAGVIAAVANNSEGIVGVAPAARIQVYKACWQLQADNDMAHCNSFTIARALVAAFDARAQVINLSLAGPEDTLLHDLISEGQRRGIVFVGAASADAASNSLSHQEGIIEVASSEGRSPIDSVVYAPGREILTLLPGSHYDFASGDSIATAEITGVVSLLLAKDPRLTPAALFGILHDSSATAGTRVDDGTSVPEHHSVDACAALAALLRRGSCKQTQDVDRNLAAEQEHRVAVN